MFTSLLLFIAISDLNTLFRGNTLVTKLIDDLMKLVGLPYLQETIKPIIDQICAEQLSCEIDPARLKEGDCLEDNMVWLGTHLSRLFTYLDTSLGTNFDFIYIENGSFIRMFSYLDSQLASEGVRIIKGPLYW